MLVATSSKYFAVGNPRRALATSCYLCLCCSSLTFLSFSQGRWHGRQNPHQDHCVQEWNWSADHSAWILGLVWQITPAYDWGNEGFGLPSTNGLFFLAQWAVWTFLVQCVLSMLPGCAWQPIHTAHSPRYIHSVQAWIEKVRFAGRPAASESLFNLLCKNQYVCSNLTRGANVHCHVYQMGRASQSLCHNLKLFLFSCQRLSYMELLL